MPSIVSVNVGLPAQRGDGAAADSLDQPWTSGIFKSPVDAPVMLMATGVEGDGQADLSLHGGIDKAVCSYPADHYPLWRNELSLPDVGAGAFGENLSITGLSEDTVCIGDVWTVGDVVLEISQPRQPCWKLGRRWRNTAFPDMVVKSGRTGWYFRVLQPGRVAKGQQLLLERRPHPEWTVAAANAVMHRRTGDTVALAALQVLSANWRRTLEKRLAIRDA